MRTPRSLRVECYRNLHMNGVVWSVRESGGKVLMHVPTIVLRNVKFIVREGGRQRVLATKSKNVHAFAKGTLVTDPDEFKNEPGNMRQRRATYNPYYCDSFIYDPGEEGQDMRPLYNSRYALLSHSNGRPKVTIKGENYDRT